MQALRTVGTEGSFLDHVPLPSSPGAQEGGQLRAMLSDPSCPNMKQAILKGGELPVMGNMQEYTPGAAIRGSWLRVWKIN